MTGMPFSRIIVVANEIAIEKLRPKKKVATQKNPIATFPIEAYNGVNSFLGFIRDILN